MSFWDFSLGQAAANITDVLKSNNATKAQIAAAEANADAQRAADTRALSLTALNQGQVQYVVAAVVIAIIGVALIRNARG